jgi:deoxyribodipyrimidine photolyase
VVAAALHWFTSDLRLHDNAALAEAGRAGPVAAVFVLNPVLLVPELSKVPAKLIHRPWTLPAMEHRMLCPDYPPPLVDLGEGRARALAAFEEARARTTGQGR